MLFLFLVALQLKPMVPAAQLMLTDSPEALFQKGMNHLHNNEIEPAIKFLTLASSTLKDDSKRAIANFDLGSIFLAKKRYREAESFFNQASQQESNISVKVAAQINSVWLLINEYKELRAEFDRAELLQANSLFVKVAAQSNLPWLLPKQYKEVIAVLAKSKLLGAEALCEEIIKQNADPKITANAKIHLACILQTKWTRKIEANPGRAKKLYEEVIKQKDANPGDKAYAQHKLADLLRKMRKDVATQTER